MRKVICGLGVLACVTLSNQRLEAQTDSLYFPGTYCMPSLPGTCINFFKLALTVSYNSGTGFWDNVFHLSGSYTASAGVEKLLVAYGGPGLLGSLPLSFSANGLIFQTAVAGNPVVDNGNPFDFTQAFTSSVQVTGLNRATFTAWVYNNGVPQVPIAECSLESYLPGTDCAFSGGGVVPEPSTWILLATGLVGIAWVDSRRRLKLAPVEKTRES